MCCRCRCMDILGLLIRNKETRRRHEQKLTLAS